MNKPHFSIEVTSAAAANPVTTAELRTHVQQNHTDDDTYLAALCAAATRYAEKYTGLYFITQSLTVRLDHFPKNCRNDEIVLPVAPVSSVAALKYLDTDGVEQTLSTSLYAYDLKSTPPRIYPAYSQVWPAIRDIEAAVRIEVVAGFGAAGSSCPQGIVHAIKLLAGHWFRNRESVSDGQLYEVPMAVTALLDSERINWMN